MNPQVEKAKSPRTLTEAELIHVTGAGDMIPLRDSRAVEDQAGDMIPMRESRVVE